MKPNARPEARLALLSARTAAARATSRTEAEALIEVVDWDALAQRLGARRLLPLLGERILAIAGECAPEPFRAATREAIGKGLEHDALLELISIQLMDSLRAAGIPALALKGPLLGRAIYGKPGRRASVDIDLLVASEDLPGAVEAAQQLGYHEPDEHARREQLPLLHLTLRRPGLPPLELHWRVHWYEPLFSRDMLFRSVDQGPLGRRATPSDELTSLLLYYARDGFVDLRLACDLGAWWDVFGARLEPHALEAIIAGYPALRRVLLAAINVADRLIGVPGAQLLGSRRAEPRVRIATRLANPDAQGSDKQRNADTWLVDWLLTPPGGRRECITRQLDAPGGSQHRQTGPASRNIFTSVNRGARFLRRYAIALLRLAWEQVGRSSPGARAKGWD